MRYDTWSSRYDEKTIESIITIIITIITIWGEGEERVDVLHDTAVGGGRRGRSIARGGDRFAFSSPSKPNLI